MDHPFVYIDASIFLGYFDTAIKTGTRILWRLHTEGLLHFVGSNLTLEYVQTGPPHIRALVEGTLGSINIFKSTEAMEILAQGYVKRGILDSSHIEVARHVALCSVAAQSNFVSVSTSLALKAERKRALNCFNQLQGYSHVNILTPTEFITRYAPYTITAK